MMTISPRNTYSELNTIRGKRLIIKKFSHTFPQESFPELIGYCFSFYLTSATRAFLRVKLSSNSKFLSKYVLITEKSFVVCLFVCAQVVKLQTIGIPFLDSCIKFNLLLILSNFKVLFQQLVICLQCIQTSFT